MARPALRRVDRPEEEGPRLAHLDRDRRLVEAAQADPARFEALYRKYLAQVYSFAYYELRDHHEAEDATERTFLAALANLGRFEERARHMLNIAPEALAAVQPAEKAGFERQIKRVPLGVVAVVAPWNYPYLTAVNAVLPALIAGNALVLKHSHQTPLCAERFGEAFAGAGVPVGAKSPNHTSAT